MRDRNQRADPVPRRMPVGDRAASITAPANPPSGRATAPRARWTGGALRRPGPCEGEPEGIEGIECALPGGAEAVRIGNEVEFPNDLLDVDAFVRGQKALGEEALLQRRQHESARNRVAHGSGAAWGREVVRIAHNRATIQG